MSLLSGFWHHVGCCHAASIFRVKCSEGGGSTLQYAICGNTRQLWETKMYFFVISFNSAIKKPFIWCRFFSSLTLNSPFTPWLKMTSCAVLSVICTFTKGQLIWHRIRCANYNWLLSIPCKIIRVAADGILRQTSISYLPLSSWQH